MVINTQSRVTTVKPPLPPFHRDGAEHRGSVDSWQFYLVDIAHHVRQVVTADPDALRVLTSTPPAARWIRPPVGDVVLVEEFLASLQRYGFSDEEAASIYLAFFTRLLGLLCMQIGLLCMQTSGPLPMPCDVVAAVSAHPTLSRLRPLLSLDRDREEFEATLDDIIITLQRDLRR